MPQVASDSTIQAASRQLPRPARPPQQLDRAPSPFESLLDDTTPADETPAQTSADNKAPAPENSQAPAKSDGTKTATPTGDATPTKPDKASDSDQKPDNSDKVAASSKAAQSVTASSGDADSTKTDGDHKTGSDQNTDNSSAAPQNDSVLSLATSQATAGAPVPIAPPVAAPAGADQPAQPAQQALLTIDVAAQLKQLNPDQPKITAGKIANDGKPTASAKNGANDGQTIEALAGDPQFSAKGTTPAQTEDKGQHAAGDTDKQSIAQARGEIPPDGGHHHEADGKAAPRVEANVLAPQITGDTLTQQTAVTASSLTADAVTAPASLITQPGPQAVAIPLSDIAVEIAGKALAGKNRFEIRLDPPELGRIEVRLDVDRDGNVTSRLTVDRADTLSLLQRDASGLERALQDAGLKTTDNGLQFSLRDQSMGQQQASGNADTAQLVVKDEGLPTIDLIPQTYSRLAGQGSGLDIRV